jgi:heptosyltransferase-2
MLSILSLIGYPNERPFFIKVMPETKIVMNKSLTPKKILVVKNRAMGDAVLGLSAIQFLKKCLPSVHITYATPEWMVDLFRTDLSLVDRAVPLDFSGPLAWTKTFLELKKFDYDVILELNQSGRSGNFFKMFSFVNSVPYYFHNHNLNVGDFVLDQGVRKPNIQRDLDLIYSYLTKVLHLTVEKPHYLDFQPEIQHTASKSKEIILGIVATRETKMWPVQNWVQFIQDFHLRFPDWKLTIPVSKNPLDQKIKKEILNHGPFSHVQWIEKPLSQLIDQLAKAQLYLGNDTGLKHLSIALGLKSLSFFGPEEPLEWHPYEIKNHPYFFIEPLECRTIDSHFCGLNHCSVMACMKPFTSEKVLERVTSLLN